MAIGLWMELYHLLCVIDELQIAPVQRKSFDVPIKFAILILENTLTSPLVIDNKITNYPFIFLQKYFQVFLWMPLFFTRRKL